MNTGLFADRHNYNISFALDDIWKQVDMYHVKQSKFNKNIFY